MGELHDFLARDHERLDALLGRALREDGTVDREPYDEFRRGLLRHIAIEEKVLFPAIRRERGDDEVLAQLHRDHAALAALLVPPPAAAEIAAIREILAHHNPLEEGEGGMYATVEALDDPAILERALAVPPVPVAPHFDTEVTRRSIAQLLQEAEEGRRRLAGTNG